MKKLLSKKGGFTLVELLVVMAIIAILVTLIIYAINAARLQSRNTERRNIVNTVKSANEGYFSTNKEYYPQGTSGTPYTMEELLGTEAFAKFAPGATDVTGRDPTDQAARMCYVKNSKSTYTLYIVPEPSDTVPSCSSSVPTSGAENFSVE